MKKRWAKSSKTRGTKKRLPQGGAPKQEQAVTPQASPQTSIASAAIDESVAATPNKKPLLAAGLLAGLVGFASFLTPSTSSAPSSPPAGRGAFSSNPRSAPSSALQTNGWGTTPPFNVPMGIDEFQARAGGMCSPELKIKKVTLSVPNVSGQYETVFYVECTGQETGLPADNNVVPAIPGLGMCQNGAVTQAEAKILLAGGKAGQLKVFCLKEASMAAKAATKKTKARPNITHHTTRLTCHK